MFAGHDLSETEWELIVDLLLREHNELPSEIHHTNNSSMRADLQARLEMINRLLERLRTPASV
jgi:hypothetical protein